MGGDAMTTTRVMTLAEARGALALALVRMQCASDAISARLTDESLRAFIDSNLEAQTAYRAMLVASLEAQKVREATR